MPEHKIHLKCPLRHARCPPLPSVPHLVIFRASKAPTSHGVGAGPGRGCLSSPPPPSPPHPEVAVLPFGFCPPSTRPDGTPRRPPAVPLTGRQHAPPLRLRPLRRGLVCPPESLRSPEARGGSEGARSLRRKTSPGISPSPFTKGFSSEALVLNYFLSYLFQNYNVPDL